MSDLPRVRHGMAIGATLLLVVVAAWAVIFASGGLSVDDSATVERKRDWSQAVAAASGDPAILAAIQTRANANRVMAGDADALVTFRTARPSGALTALPALGDPVRGSYSPVVAWPLVGIHAVLTFDGRVLSYGTTTTGVRTGYYVYDVWDPLLGLGSESHTVLPNSTAVDIFCNAQLLLPDGNIEMWGGDVINLEKGRASLQPNDDSNLFTPLDNNLVRTGKMFRKRWYATATTLPDGEVYIQGGTGGEDFPEVRTATGTFRLLNGASTTYLGALYPRNFVAPDGNIFGTRYEEMYRVDPNGAGELKRAGKFPGSNMGASSTAVMFRPGKVLQLGGGYDLSFASPLAHVIDINPATPVVQQVASPLYRRHWATSTVLPDGRVFVSGGSVADNDPVNGVDYTGEIYDPVTNTWSEAATAQQMRLYHSTALLLPDATVLTLGGGANGPQLNLNAEVYYPPYLFNADGTPASRPIITATPMTADPGQAIAIATPDPAAITRVTLLKTGSVTHSFDMDQRFLELPFTVVGNQLQANLPPNTFETPPGYYMVFVFNGLGVPSEAAMLRINVQVPARLTVNKVVVNDHGGNKLASDFSFSVNGAAPVKFDADGSNVVNLAAGTYTVTEPATPGYATTSLANCSGIVLAAGDTATCTITNNDIAGGFTATTGSSKPVYVPGETVTLTARVLNIGLPVSGARVNFDALKPNGINHVTLAATTDSNGNASASFVSGIGSSSIGTYQLTTTATSGGLTAQAFATFAVLKPQVLPATLTVRKVMVNENGGSKSASDFSFSVNGAAPVRFEADGSNVLSLSAGTYTVTEMPSADYTPSLANCTGIVLAAGDSATCTITNTDTPTFVATAGTSKPNYAPGETVTMMAHVLNGGVPVAGAQVNFDALKPNGINHVVLAATTNGNGDASVSFVSGTGSSSIGTYQLTATATSGGFTAKGFASFTVLKPPAMLTINKIVVNDDGGSKVASDFSFSVNGAAPVAFEADGSNVLSVPAGAYTVTEPATAGYAASLSNCSGIVLAAGGSATCTITNNDQAPASATLIVNKVVVNDDGGSKVAADFGFSVNGAATVAFETDGSNALTVPAGTYTITEPAVAGYTASFANCSDIALAAGGSATCTITNNDAPPTFTATTGTSKAVYIRGETVTMTANVLRNGLPVAGARVNFDALKPNLVNHVLLSATTDSNGNASVSFVSGTGPSSIGTYQLTATATSGSLTTQAHATFVVQ
ncbi:galactose oxidase-like domain-containing protein [Lysobacter fragariae]